MSVDTMEQLLLEKLSDLYSAEIQIMMALPQMARAAHSKELNVALKQHLEETGRQIDRLGRIFAILEKSPGGKTCEAMKVLLQQCVQVLVKARKEGALRDAAMSLAAQRVEHYEMAGYAAARMYAEILGHTDVAQLLQVTLDEEKTADKNLAQIAKAAHVQTPRAA